MPQRTIDIIMNRVTGRMSSNQHLVRSIVALRNEGGGALASGDMLYPDPILVGRNEERLRALASAYNIECWDTNLERCLANPEDSLYFDAQTTSLWADALRLAIAAGKHAYCEKPVAGDLAMVLELLDLARHAGSMHGVVQDKLFYQACGSSSA